MPTQDRAVSTSLLKALDVLSVLAARPEGMALAEVVAATRLPRTTALRIINTLAARGLAIHRDRRVAVTEAFRQMSLGDRYHRLRGRYRSILEAIAAAVGELVLLGVRDGATLIHLDYVESDHAVRVAPAPTTHYDLRTTAQGKLIISRFPDLIERERSRALRAELRAIARTRVAWSNQESRAGVVAVACPGLVDEGDEPVIAVAWPVMRFNQRDADKAIRAVRSAVRRARAAEQ